MTTPAEVIDQCACIRVRRASRAVTRVFDEAVRPLGIKSTQFALLVAVSENKDVTTSTHAELLGMERTTMLRNMELMEREGLIELHQAGRSRVPSLNSRGRDVLAAALPLWRAAQDRLRAKIRERSWDEVIHTIDLVREAS